MRAIVTLTTDFGYRDPWAGMMKGVMLSINADLVVVDLTHGVPPQDITSGALALADSVSFFPQGAIHVAVVDPGVGTARRPLAARIGAQYYVGPDNGLLTLWLERAEVEGLETQFVHLDRPQYWLPQVSHVFHGRDIFAPVAAHLAAGVPLEALGTPLTDVVRLDLPRPTRQGKTWRGQVIHIDHFGNLASNIREEHLQGETVVTVSLCGVNLSGMVRTFGERPPGELVALFGSTGNLIVSEVNGSAARRLDAPVGAALEVRIA